MPKPKVAAAEARVERAVLDRAVRVGRTPAPAVSTPPGSRPLSARATRSPAAAPVPPGGRWPKGEEA